MSRLSFHLAVEMWNRYFEYINPEIQSSKDIFDEQLNPKSKSNSGDLGKNALAELDRLTQGKGLSFNDIELYGTYYQNQHVIPLEVVNTHKLAEQIGFTSDQPMNGMLLPTPKFVKSWIKEYKTVRDKKGANVTLAIVKSEDPLISKEYSDNIEVLFTTASSHTGYHADYNSLVDSLVNEILNKLSKDQIAQIIGIARLLNLLRIATNWGVPLYRNQDELGGTFFGARNHGQEWYNNFANIVDDKDDFFKLWTGAINLASDYCTRTDPYKDQKGWQPWPKF
jgi:hypothetical protein